MGAALEASSKVLNTSAKNTAAKAIYQGGLAFNAFKK